ncbi:hypothetical protein [Streptomyces formicae]|uniref:Uncharacterized protein n=1 Tax=Streptomyces formicae TaxID=1616117 RepID=A0ABY3WMD6_9ACTN|nr:hypothetical protein [Streptomyces formicae]UNM13799.1 hypothetical protein J4032_22155 [Streptomyces formicae]
MPEPTPAEHCGHLSPRTLLTTPPVECVLPASHTGDHADDRNVRWWNAPAPVPADVREQIAEAIALHRNGSASDGRGWYRNDDDHADSLALADAVLRVPAIAGLQQLAAERDMLGRETDRLRRDWTAMRDRAERAEAALSEARTDLAIQKAISADLRVESKARGDMLERVRGAAALHRQGLISDLELYAVIGAAPDPQEQP